MGYDLLTTIKMKKLFFYISLIACTWACEKDQIDEITPTEIGGGKWEDNSCFSNGNPWPNGLCHNS